MLLGLDVSTSITGYTILDCHGKLIRCNAWDVRNKNRFKNYFEKANYIKDELCYIKGQYPIEKIYIERPFMFFRSGGSSAKTMASLQKFNGIISWICYDILNQPINFLTASEARKLCGIKVARGEKAKKIVMNWLLKNESDFKVEYTHKNNPKPKYFDMADSVVLAKAGYYLYKKNKKEGNAS